MELLMHAVTFVAGMAFAVIPLGYACRTLTGLNRKTLYPILKTVDRRGHEDVHRSVVVRT